MRVHQLTEAEKQVLAALDAEQGQIQEAQKALDEKKNMILAAFCAQTGLKLPLLRSECGNFVVEAQQRAAGPQRVA